MSVCADANITGTFRTFLDAKKIIINVNYKISTMVVFCPGGLLSRGLLSVIRARYLQMELFHLGRAG